jgi:hypothetical protein
VQFNPHARKFQGVPFPDFPKLDIIFGNWPMYSYPTNRIPPRPPMAIPPQHPTNQLPNPPTLSKASSLSNAVGAAAWNDCMLDSHFSQHNDGNRLKDPQQPRLPDPHQHLYPAATCNIEREMDLYQHAHAQDASPREALAAFKILRDETSSMIFVWIRDKELRALWLQAETDELIAGHGNMVASLITH